MYLKCLDIHGFKTFAQRTTFVFPQGITAVVGANGSGKSNIVDAIRWVLGEQSFTHLRSKRTEDLIFSGGKGRAPFGFADVSLTIDNSDRLLPLAFDEVTIGRRAFRNGDNEYTINRSRVRLRDVLEVVAPLGSSFTLINQGLVDAALSLQAEDRHRLFEDAAELGPYQMRKAEAERRLRETDANLVRIDDLLQEQEPQLRSLKRQARDAEIVAELQSRLHSLLLQHYRSLATASRIDVEQAQAAEQETQTALVLARDEREIASAALIQERRASDASRAGLAVAEDAAASLERRLGALQREQGIVEERRAGLIRRHAELLDRRRSLDEAYVAAQLRLLELAEIHRQAQAAVAIVREQYAARSQSATEVLAARHVAEADVEAARAQIARRSAALGKIEAQYASLGEQLSARGDEIERARHKAAQTEEMLAAARERVRSHETLLGEADDAVRLHETALQAQDEAARAAREARHAASDALALARRRRADLELRRDSLARSLEGHEGANAAVRAALAWAAREGHADFRLVSSIVTAPQHLEAAVEVALGARLQQIVVDRWEAAEAAITELKRTGGGRATFLPLDTLRVSRRVAAPRHGWPQGILGCAADMVAFDEHYLAVIDLLLGRTILAEDLQAARAALRSFDTGVQIVTLAGEHVASSGALTGGSTRAGGGVLAREREYRQLPEQVAAAREQVAALERAAAEHEQSLAHALATVREAENALRAARIRRDRAQSEHERARRETQRVEGELTTARGHEERAMAEHATAQARLQTMLDSLQAEQAALADTQATLAAREARLAERQEAARADDAALDELRSARAAAEGDLRAHAGAYAQQELAERALAVEAETLAATVAQSEAEVGALERGLAELGQQADELMVELHGANLVLDAAREAARLAQSRRDQAETAERAAYAAIVEREQAASHAELALQRANAEWQALWERAAADDIDLDQLTPAMPGERDLVVLAEEVADARNRLRRLGPVNALAPEEYATLLERHTFMQKQAEDVRATAALLRDAIADLGRYMDDQFRVTFAGIAQEFSAAFVRLFGGGSAELMLVDGRDDGGRSGVEIVAQPPGKRKLNLQLLSGGERALTGAALVFAILRHQPRPFCVLDEVDAALDEANVVRFREALLELAGDTQFIIVTHNRGTVEAAATLYGVTMGTDGVSRVLSLRLEEYVDELASSDGAAAAPARR